MNNVVPAVVHGDVAKDYFVDPEGNVWSTKQKKPRLLKWHMGGGGYPTISISEGKTPRTCYVHKIVCETFHKFPIPSGVSKKEWRETPDSVKAHVYKTFEVNHIDHDHENFHPSNLEWVSRMENLFKYQEHKKAKA